MSETATQPWARQPKEPDRWLDRFQRFLYLGVARSIYATYIAERAEKAKTKKQRDGLRADISARVGLPKSWRDAAVRWDWKSRATAFDEQERKKRDALYAARSSEILVSGFAARFTRIAELNRLAELLQEEIWTEEKRWLPDVKQIGSGEFAERVDIVRFNAAAIDAYLKTLEHIALEQGDRQPSVKISGSLGIAQMTADDLAKAAMEADAWEKTAMEPADALTDGLNNE